MPSKKRVSSALGPPRGVQLTDLDEDVLALVLTRTMQDRRLYSVPDIVGAARQASVSRTYLRAFERACAPLRGKVHGERVEPDEASSSLLAKCDVVLERRGSAARVEGGVRLESIPCSDTGRVRYRPMSFHVVIVAGELRVYLQLGGKMWWRKSRRRRMRRAGDVWLLRMGVWSASAELSGRSLGKRPCTELQHMLPYTRGSCRHEPPVPDDVAADLPPSQCTEAFLRRMCERDAPEHVNAETVRLADGVVCTPWSNDANTATYEPRARHGLLPGYYASRWGDLKALGNGAQGQGGVWCEAYTHFWNDRGRNRDPWKPFDGVVTVAADCFGRDARALFSFDALTALFGVNAPDSLYPAPVLPRWVVGILRGQWPSEAEKSTSFGWSGLPRKLNEEEDVEQEHYGTENEEDYASTNPWRTLYYRCCMREEVGWSDVWEHESVWTARSTTTVSHLPRPWVAVARFMRLVSQWTESERFEWLEEPHYACGGGRGRRACAAAATKLIANQAAMERRLNAKGQELVRRAQAESDGASGATDARYVASRAQWVREGREERLQSAKTRRADRARARRELGRGGRRSDGGQAAEEREAAERDGWWDEFP
jgi:hypothetical protein